jgi:transketolase
MRTTFINELLRRAGNDARIALLVGDLGYSVVEKFADQLPDQFVNIGIAEQNMAGIAAGMASEGHHVFTYSIANFSTFRAAEQLRNDIDYHTLPVTTVIVGGGLAYGNLGYSHHAIQDFALMRSLPNTLILSPGDPEEVRACMDYILRNPQPSYLRLGKNGEPTIHKRKIECEVGKLVKIAAKGDTMKTAYVCTGTGLEHAVAAFEKSEDGTLYSLPIWGFGARCKDTTILLSRFTAIRTFETHLVDAGFGSWISESFPKFGRDMPKLCMHGYDMDILGKVGSQSELESLTSLKFDDG